MFIQANLPGNGMSQPKSTMNRKMQAGDLMKSLNEASAGKSANPARPGKPRMLQPKLKRGSVK